MTSALIIDIEKNAIVEDRRVLPEFRPGDTLRVGVRVTEGTRSRIQVFEGVCIARRDAGWRSSLTVRKLSFNYGVERTFNIYHPLLETLEVIRRGKMRRGKLYYLRDRRGKSARITETRSRQGHRRLLERPSSPEAAVDQAENAGASS